MKTFLACAFVLTFAANAAAQAPPAAAMNCPPDAVQASADSLPVAKTFAILWCHDNKDTDGALARTPFTWEVYRNNVLLTGVVVVRSANANSGGVWAYYMLRNEATAGNFNYEVAAVSADGLKSSRVPFVVPVVGPQTPTVPIRPRVVLLP